MPLRDHVRAKIVPRTRVRRLLRDCKPHRSRHPRPGERKHTSLKVQQPHAFSGLTTASHWSRHTRMHVANLGRALIIVVNGTVCGHRLLHLILVGKEIVDGKYANEQFLCFSVSLLSL